MTLEQIQMVQASFAKIAPIVGPATDRKLRRCSALVAGFRKETRLSTGVSKNPGRSEVRGTLCGASCCGSLSSNWVANIRRGISPLALAIASIPFG